MAQPSQKAAPDWERIEADYRAGLLSVREIAASNGVSHVAIGKRAKRDGWERDLQAKIKAKADDRSVALSRNEFGRSGFVYVIYVEDSAGVRFYKIGMASTFSQRFQAHQCASPFDIRVACAYFVGNMRAEERALHTLYQGSRVRGEWFMLSDDDVRSIASRSALV